jgi:hypothetical protein
MSMLSVNKPFRTVSSYGVTRPFSTFASTNAAMGVLADKMSLMTPLYRAADCAAAASAVNLPF